MSRRACIHICDVKLHTQYIVNFRLFGGYACPSVSALTSAAMHSQNVPSIMAIFNVYTFYAIKVFGLQFKVLLDFSLYNVK